VSLAGVELLVGRALGVEQKLAQDHQSGEQLDVAVDPEGGERHRARGDAGSEGTTSSTTIQATVSASARRPWRIKLSPDRVTVAISRGSIPAND